MKNLKRKSQRGKWRWERGCIPCVYFSGKISKGRCNDEGNIFWGGLRGV